MLYYDFNNLDNLIYNTSLKKSLNSEILRLEKYISLYTYKSTNLLSTTTSLMSITKVLDHKKLDDFYNATKLLEKTFENLENLIKLITNTKKRIGTCFINLF